MPQFVKTPADEAKWAQAKRAVEDSKDKKESDFSDSDWALVNHIFHKGESDLLKAIDYTDYLGDLPQESEDAEDNDYSYWGEKDPRAAGQQAPESRPTSPIDPSSSRSEPLSEEEITRLKELAPLWLQNLSIQRKHDADPRKNPILAAEGHKNRHLSEMMADYHKAWDNVRNSDEYKDADHLGKKQLQIKHKLDWHKKNPTHHASVMDKLDDTRKIYDLAGRAHLYEKKEMLQDALTPGLGSMSSQEAAQHFGIKEGGEDDMPSVSTVRSAAASFGQKNQKMIQDELGRLSHIKGLSPEEEEILQDKGSKAPLLQHPAFQDPENKKLINDFYALHGKAMRDESIKQHMKTLGIDEGLHQHIDMGQLADAAMTGMLRGASDHQKGRGKSFGANVHETARNHVRAELQRQHPIAASLRRKANAAAKAAQAVKQPAGESTQPTSAIKRFSPEEIAAMNAKYAAAGKNKIAPPKSDITSKMPSDMKERHQSILAAKKTQGEE